MQKKMLVVLRSDRRRCRVRGLDRVDALPAASRSAARWLTPPDDGRSDGRPRRPFARPSSRSISCGRSWPTGRGPCPRPPSRE